MRLIITDPDTGEKVEQKKIDFGKHVLVDTDQGVWEARVEYHRSTQRTLKLATTYVVGAFGYLAILSIESGSPPALTDVGFIILLITMVHLAGTADRWWV